MTVPLRHFLVGLAFLLAGVLLGVRLAQDGAPGLARLAHVHLLLVGWVCVTIMGAMTQFVPVWSGATIHSRRLATLQLALVVAGLVGFAAALVHLELELLAVFGAVMLAGFWVFVYNVGRTLATVDEFDVTERHFAIALGFVLALTALGVLLAYDLREPILAEAGLSHVAVVQAHATLAVFGAVLTTVYGALYQLGTMFTQTDLHGVDHPLQRIEEVGHPLGVVLLAGGRLSEVEVVATVGAAGVLLAAVAFSAILLRKLLEMQVQRTPMHSRYAVVGLSLAAWAVASAPAWLDDPLALSHRYGGEGTVHLLALGVIGFVVLGTLYHIVPFIVWVHEYSDRLGFEPVPMIDDLYDDRLAAVDGAALLTGTAAIVIEEFVGVDARLTVAGGLLVAAGVLVFTANQLLVLRRHSPHPLDRILLGRLSPRPTPTPTEGGRTEREPEDQDEQEEQDEQEKEEYPG